MKVRILFVGIWMGLWLAMMAWTAYGVIYLQTHPSSDRSFDAWLSVAIWGPAILCAMRFWKWVLSLALAGLGIHELHKLEKSMQVVVLLVGLWQLEKPENQSRVKGYWRWLVAKPQGPGNLSSDARLLLRLGAVIGLMLYTCLAAEGLDGVRNAEANQRDRAAAYALAHPGEKL